METWSITKPSDMNGTFWDSEFFGEYIWMTKITWKQQIEILGQGLDKAQMHIGFLRFPEP
jgi:hypothetical protein